MGAVGAHRLHSQASQGWAGGRRLRYKESNEAIWTPPAAQIACEDILCPHTALHSEPLGEPPRGLKEHLPPPNSLLYSSHGVAGFSSKNNPKMCSWLGVGGEGSTSTPLWGPWKGPETLGSGGPPLAPWASWKAFLPGEWSVESLSSEALDEAAREEARATVPLQGPLVPAVLTLLVHKDNVSLLQLYLCLALGRVRDHDTVPEGGTDTKWVSLTQKAGE